MNKSRLQAKVGRCRLEARDYDGALRAFEAQLASAEDEEPGAIRKEGRACAHANVALGLALQGRVDDALAAVEASDGLLRDAPAQEARNAALAGALHFKRGAFQAALRAYADRAEIS